MSEYQHTNPEHEHRTVFTFDEMLMRWVTQETGRYTPLLLERGFLHPDKRNDTACVHDAAKTWRATYLEGLDIAHREWTEHIITQSREVLSWKLGGWQGWKGYRTPGSRVTTFGDVAQALCEKKLGIPTGHSEKIPELAQAITHVLCKGSIFVLQCAQQTAVLEGTHRISAVAYAVMQRLPLPLHFSVYICQLPDDHLAAFTQFCEDLPTRFGKYRSAAPFVTS